MPNTANFRTLLFYDYLIILIFTLLLQLSNSAKLAPLQAAPLQQMTMQTQAKGTKGVAV